ncbi:MAG: sensor domain-containing diguanylate cyclase [Deltaproteobacteria bacterium]|jgi:diguanylate cyclase (GGDEF)-like protein|nr:sensor domain-containing diguanylate cyclase [Deltaproteobacteria bacterium]
MNGRQYNHDADDARHLFASIIESLSSSAPRQSIIASILEQVCRHFKFGWGFVYEADHTQALILKECFLTSDGVNPLPKSFVLKDHFSEEEITGMLVASVYSQNIDYDEHVAPDGHSRIFRYNAVMLAPIADDDGRVIGLVGIMDRRRNILMDERSVRAAQMALNLLGNHIKLRILQKRLEYARESLISTLDNTGINIYVNDFHTHEILYVNQSMATPYGGLKNMLGKKCWQVLHKNKTGQCDYCPKKQIIDAAGNPTKIYSWDHQRPLDGAWFRVISTAFRWVDGRLAHIVSSVDITENKNNEATIAYMANYDVLTNLPNRRKLRFDYEEGAHLARGGEKDGETGYLLFLDLDNFKELNDSLGHQAGDELLAQIGSALSLHPLTDEHVYRYGGDEFVLLYHRADRKQLNKVINFLFDRFEQPWPLKKSVLPRSVVCRASIGVVPFADDSGNPCSGKTLDELLHKADLMMYRAKQNGGGIACFSDGEIVKPDRPQQDREAPTLQLPSQRRGSPTL